jgi:hypothetical protein
MAGFRWLTNAINLGRHNPKAVFGGAGLSLLLMLVPSLLTVPLQLGGTPSPTRALLGIGISIVLGLLLAPLYGGFLGIIDAAERGRAAKATDVFAPYRSGGGAGRMIGFVVAMLGVYVLVMLVVAGVAGTGIFHWYMQILAAQGKPTPELMQLPAGFGTAVALIMVFWLLLMGIYAVGLGQVALAGRSPLGALKDGFFGSIKNLLPLLVMAISLCVAFLLLALGFGILGAIAALVGNLAGLWLTILLLIPIYVALVLVLYVVMFGVMYFMWRDICGGSDTSPQEVAAMTA